MNTKKAVFVGVLAGFFLLVSPTYAQASVDNYSAETLQLIKRLETLIKLMEELKAQIAKEEAVIEPVVEQAVEETPVKAPIQKGGTNGTIPSSAQA